MSDKKIEDAFLIARARAKAYEVVQKRSVGSKTCDGNMPERIRTQRAAEITGLSIRGVQSMAARGDIPGAAKLGKVWTFNERKLRAWIKEKEEEAQQTFSWDRPKYSEPALHLSGSALDEACIRFLYPRGRKPRNR